MVTFLEDMLQIVLMMKQGRPPSRLSKFNMGSNGQRTKNTTPYRRCSSLADEIR